MLDRLSAGTTSSTTTVVVIAMGWPPWSGPRGRAAAPAPVPSLVGAENLCHLGRCPGERGRFGRCSASAGPVLALPVLTWPDWAWLALLAGTVLAGMRLLVTPGTILHWHRDIVRRRWGRLSRRGRFGRPATHRRVGLVVLRLTRENESWGYRRIHGELADWASRWRRPQSGRSSRTPGSTRRRAATVQGGPSSYSVYPSLRLDSRVRNLYYTASRPSLVARHPLFRPAPRAAAAASGPHQHQADAQRAGNPRRKRCLADSRLGGAAGVRRAGRRSGVPGDCRSGPCRPR